MVNYFFKSFVAIQLFFSPMLIFAKQNSNIELITENIIKVCDKPQQMGRYWDVRVKGDGNAAIKLKLVELGVTGEVDFSEGEWEGIKRTIEDNKNYRECVTMLSPIFIKKFGVISDVKVKNEWQIREELCNNEDPIFECKFNRSN